MKKISITFLLFFVSLFCCFAWQKNYRASDEEYIELTALKNISGKAFPEMTAPITSAQMLNILDMINPYELPEYAVKVYEKLYKKLSEPQVLFKSSDVGGNISLSVSPFCLYGNLTEKEYSYEDLKVKDNKRYNLYDIDADLFITENFYGKIHLNGTPIQGEESDFADGKMRCAHIFDLDSMSQDWPDVAYGSLGNKYMNFTIGRDRLSAGSGATGNLYLSENRRFDDFAKFSIAKNPISYDFTAIVYDGYKTSTTELKSNDFDAPRKMAFIHRFSSALFHRITLSAYEGAVIYGEDSLSDLRALNPFMFIHNNGTYYSGNTNNFAGIEVGAVFKNGIAANLQILVDQFQLSGESDESGKTQMGFLANANGAWIVKNGLLTAYAEGVYATDGLYLKEYDNTKNGYRDNGKTYFYPHTDMISGYKRYASGESDEFRYMGYPEGGSLIKFALGSTYKVGNYKFEADMSFAAKGCYGIGKNESRVLDVKSLYDKTQYCFILSTSADATFMKGIDCTACISSVNFWNYNHINDNRSNQIQVYLGCKIRPLEFFAKRANLEAKH